MSNTTTSATENLAKNSIWLYIRSIIVMTLGLYTSRLILQNLGVDDYGVYNIVGSVVVFFSFLNSSISSACLRFYNIAIGEDNNEKLKLIFITSFWLLMVVSFIMFALAEIFGKLYVINSLCLPEGRYDAALIVFHVSALTMVMDMISIPFNSLIIAHEKMTVYAYIDIINAILRLVIVLLLPYIDYDTLITYAVLVLIVQFIYQYNCRSYCRRQFEEVKIHFVFDRHIAKEIGNFSFWVILNAVVSIFIFQGLSVLYNLYYGVVANAALGIANQVRTCALKLTQNFAVSFNPQLTKNYAKNDFKKVNLLYLTGSKLIYVVFSIVTIVFILYPDRILQIWLTEVPAYSAGFVRVLIINCICGFIGCMSGALINATGKIVLYQVLNAIISCIALGLSYLSLSFITNIFLPYLIIALSSLVQSFLNIYLACRYINTSFLRYFASFSRVIIAHVITIVFGFHFCTKIPNSFAIVCMYSLFIIIQLGIFEYIIGFDKTEKLFLRGILVKLIKKN